MKRHGAILSLSPMLAAAAVGQTSITTSPPAVPKTPYHGLATFQSPRFGPRPLVGAPYYGEAVSQHEQTRSLDHSGDSVCKKLPQLP